MPLPPHIALVTVTATYTRADGNGSPAAGTVEFVLRNTVQIPADDTIVIPAKVTGTLGVDGRLQVQLPSPADPAVVPAGVTWWVVERFDGAEPRTYDIALPAGPATVDLADLAPAEASRGLYAYVLAERVGKPGGVAPLGDDGLVPAEHLPPASGGAAVVSVDGRTGVVDLSDRYVQAATRGAAGGVATLDSGAHVPAGQLPIGTAAAQVAAGDHTHTAAQVGADPAGTAAAAIAAHTAAADPHPGYLTAADADAAYAPLDHTHGDTAGGGQVFPLAVYGLTAATDNPLHFTGSGPVQSNEIHFARLWVPAGVAITNLWVAVRDAGVYDGATPGNRIGIYDDAGTLLAATADDPNLFTGNGWRGGPLAGGPISAQGVARLVYIGALPRGMTTVPQFAFPASATDSQVAWWAAGPGGGNRRGFYLGGQSDLPATIDPGPGGTGTTSTFVPLYGIS